MFKLSHRRHIRGLSLFRPRTGEEFFFLDKKCASCFLQCFSLRLLTKWLPLWPSFSRPPHQTLDTSLTSKHLQTFCSESTPPLDCLVFLIFGILWLFIFFLWEICTQWRDMISNLSLAYSEITPYVSCIVWIAKVAFGSPCFWPCAVNILQPDFRE